MSDLILKYNRLHPLTQKEGLDLYLQWKKIPCIPTGYPPLDSILGGGLGVKQITSIVGFTGTGKSELTRQIRNNIVTAGYNIIHIDAELGIHRLIERDLVQLTTIRPGILRKETFNPKQKKIFTLACNTLAERENLITLNPGGGIPLDKLLTQITKILTSFSDISHPALIILDSVQRFSQGSTGGDERVKLKRTMYALEKYIHKHNAALLIVSEGRRPPKKREDEDQTLEVYKSKAAESNAVEFTSDTLIVLEQENSKKQFVKPLGDIPAVRIVRLIIPKNRNGNEGFFEEKIYFKAPYWQMEIK